MSFQLTPLAGNTTLVEGTDVRGVTGSTVLHSEQWEDVKRHTNYTSALSAVDAAIAALVAPIQEAIDKAEATLAQPKLDPLFYIVEREGVDSVAGQPEVITKLRHDAVILRAIEEGQTDRLIWVNDELVVTAAPVETTEVSDV